MLAVTVFAGHRNADQIIFFGVSIKAQFIGKKTVDLMILASVAVGFDFLCAAMDSMLCIKALFAYEMEPSFEEKQIP